MSDSTTFARSLRQDRRRSRVSRGWIESIVEIIVAIDDIILVLRQGTEEV